MLIERKILLDLKQIIEQRINQVFDINTQYKFLILNKKIEEELEISRTQINYILQKYAELDENNLFILDEKNGVKIQSQYKDICIKEVDNLYQYKVQIPEIYFSLDELKELKLTLNELILFKDFIKGDLI